MKINGITLTGETLRATDEYFSKLSLACADEVISGEVHVNDLAEYIIDCINRSKKFLAGEGRNSLTYLQHGLYVQTGEEISIL